MDIRPAIAADVPALGAAVRAAPARLGQVRLVAVDGPAGSGKTTLAGWLAAALGHAPVVHLDDLYAGWDGLRADLWERLDEQVLRPLAGGGQARFQRYDWDAGRFAEWVTLPRDGILVVEGVGAAARPVEPSCSLRVWVEAPAQVRLARGVARDGEQLRTRWQAWMRRERAHFAADGTRDRADVIVDGTAGAAVAG